MKSVAIVDVQGFKKDDNSFILKEIAIVCGDQVQVFLLQPPFPTHNLKFSERKQVRWIEKNRGMHWNDGYIRYEQLPLYIDEFLIDKKILCKGLEKVCWVKQILDNMDVINLENWGCPKLLSLYEEYRNCNDIYNCIFHSKVCALKNVLCLKKWCLINKLL